MLRRLLFAVAAALLVVIVIEGLARVFLQSVPPTGYDAASWRTHWIQNHAASEDLYYDYDAHDPLLGWRVQPGLQAVPAFPSRTLSSNDLGLRDHATPGVEAARPQRRILILGDSFTFGEDVGDDETYPARLDASLPRSEVLNFGVHGYGHDQMLLLFREEGRRLQPDIVILGFVYDDIYRNLVGFRDFAKPRFVLESEDLVLRGVPVPTPAEVAASAWQHSAALDAFSIALARFEFARGGVEARARVLAEAILDALLAEIRAVGARPLFVHLPAGSEMLAEPGAPSKGEAFLDDYCRGRQVECLSLAPQFRDAVARGIEDPKRLHWGPGGHLAAARGLAHYLTSDPPRRPR